MQSLLSNTESRIVVKFLGGESSFSLDTKFESKLAETQMTRFSIKFLSVSTCLF